MFYLRHTFFLSVILHSIIFAKNIDFVGDFLMRENFSDFESIEVCGHSVREFETSIESYINNYYHDGIDHVIVLNLHSDPLIIQRLPKKKINLTLWEPHMHGFQFETFKLYDRVYSFNDDLIKEYNLRKFNYPLCRPMTEDIVPFKEKKLSSIMFRNPVENRIELIEFFNSKDENELHFYGRCPKQFIGNTRYKGPVPNIHSTKEKLDVIRQYKFYFCYENSRLPGYISEKIFNCFEVGIVPIYDGAPNILNYVPKDCLIDRRDFKSLDELYEYITSMSEETYNQYLENIRRYLASPQSYQFKKESWRDLVLDIAKAEP